MATQKRDAGLPEGHVSIRIELLIEGPTEDATEKLAHVLKAVPRETRLEALAQMEERLRELRSRLP